VSALALQHAVPVPAMANKFHFYCLRGCDIYLSIYFGFWLPRMQHSTFRRRGTWRRGGGRRQRGAVGGGQGAGPCQGRPAGGMGGHHRARSQRPRAQAGAALCAGDAGRRP